jgi:DNA mismatch repair protein MutL
VPLEEIDVNVHPAKTEIRFRRTEAVKDAIADAVREALAKGGIVVPGETQNFERQAAATAGGAESVPNVIQPAIGFQPVDPASVPSEPVGFDGGYASDSGSVHQTMEHSGVEAITSTEFINFAAESERQATGRDEADSTVSLFFDNTADRSDVLSPVPTLPPVNSAERFVKSAEVADLSSHKVKPIAQLHDSFIIAVDDEGMLLIDQHVAHERILFDKFRKSETERKIESQNLLLPETIDLTPAQSQAFELIEGDLASLGFGLMKLSGRTVAIKSIPTDLPPSEARNLFAEILDHVELDKRGNAKQTLREDIAASLACKAAVKINMKLTPEKMQWLIDRLLLTSSPTTCPHGRPVILRLTMKDIERGFHRT